MLKNWSAAFIEWPTKSVRDCELLAGGKIGFPSKLQAASQLARMCGWDAPQKVNIEAGDSLSVFLREIVTR